MKLYKLRDKWFIATGKIGKRLVFGAGSTNTKALSEALRA